MQDLFTTAQLFLPKQGDPNDPIRKKMIKELEILLYNSPFLGQGEKQKMAQVIPAFSNDIIQDLTQTLIRQNLRGLQQKTNKN